MTALPAATPGPASRASSGPSSRADGRRLVEIRAYRLRPGTRDAFHDVVVREAIPLLRGSGMDVVAHGPSAADEQGYYLIRSFADPEDLRAREDGFYGSAAWREGPREAVVSRIETYVDTLLWMRPEAIDDLRAAHAA